MACGPSDPLQGVVKVGAVDADQHKALGGQYGIRGFPTIKIFGANKNKPEEYQGTLACAVTFSRWESWTESRKSLEGETQLINFVLQSKIIFLNLPLAFFST